MLIFIKPAKSAVPVRKPGGDYLKADGEKVERSAFWVRRLNDGDVIEVKAAKTTAAKTKAGE
ncbi:DUF2635 domain-containing protein [Shewanella khirikhana]|uniref:DUF2635 domain-containing protein n=1 Tax=Shewanella khirikhana TaxID=1965282 RepID=A0ABM7D1J9_9GAMM|nr:DUF2635 domain-containing protein [Shewanella khirikhana]AZQ10162.1 hypothetical protein STH12_01026 [Shewanella khirikhana]